MTDTEKRAYLERLDDPIALDNAFKKIVRTVKENKLEKGYRFDIAKDIYFHIFPDCMFFICEGKHKQISIEQGERLLFDIFIAEGGLKQISQIVQLLGISRKYNIAGNEVEISPGREKAEVYFKGFEEEGR